LATNLPVILGRKELTMTRKLFAIPALVFSCTFLAAQTVPMYRVTEIDRTVSAVDYQYRNGPTQIDFHGTVLLPDAKGNAIVDSKEGRVEIDARFGHLPAPTRYGREYLTYVLWAITPEGHAKNLGEIVAGSSDKGKLHVTTDLQAFGLIVTAEPYSAVRTPSDAVVMENQLRPDTIGSSEPIQAKYELLPRGHYTYNVPDNLQQAEGNGPMLSKDQYQEVLEIYQAQNALQIAQSAGADQYAADTFGKASSLLRQAQDEQARKAPMTMVVTTARKAAQTAEDARIIAVERKQQDELSQNRAQVAAALTQQAQAQAVAQTAQAEAASTRALLEQERAARQQAEAQAAAATAPAPPPPPSPQTAVQAQPAPDAQQKTQLRLQLYQQLSAVLPARDTPRGLVLTLADSDFIEAGVNPAVYGRLARVSAIIAATAATQPGLTVEVDGHEVHSGERANAVRDLLLRDGLPANAVVARALGDSRPMVSNATPSGREQNRRVEITIYGSPIGDMPYWARSYSLTPRQ
jgi:flagellar motor protein MotB